MESGRRYPALARAFARSLRENAGRHEPAHRLLVTVTEPRFRRRQLVGADTILVLEGFGGSGNTFVVAALGILGLDVDRVAHHHHAPSQVRAGIRRELPTIVLVRSPCNAIASLVRRDFVTSARAGFRSYAAFHDHLHGVADRVLAVTFEELASEPDRVVRAIACHAGHVPERCPRLDDQRDVFGSTDHERLARVAPDVMTRDAAWHEVTEVAEVTRARAVAARERFLERAGRL